MSTVIHRTGTNSPSISLVIPCYNEEACLPALESTLRPLLAQIAHYGPAEVILIDDGSTDGTWDALQHIAARVPQVRLVRHTMNYGLGAALRTGLAHARGEIVVTTDADGTYPFTGISPLLARLTTETDIVTASPYHPDGGMDGEPAWQRALNRGISQCYRLMLGERGSAIHTYTSLFRAYRRSVLPYITPEHEGFVANAEILARGVLGRYTIAEYPTVLRARRYGQSKARGMRIVLTHLRFLAALLLHRVHVRRPRTAATVPAVATTQEAMGD